MSCETGIVLNTLMFDDAAVERFMAFFDDRDLPRPSAVYDHASGNNRPQLGIFAGRYGQIIDLDELEFAFKAAGWSGRSNACLIFQAGLQPLRVLTP